MEENNTLNKTVEFFKKNMYNLMLILVSVVFIFKDMILITKTGKQPIEILASSLISLAMGITFTSIMGRKGIAYAQSTISYINMMKTYANEIEKTNDNIDKLDDFLENKNEEKLKKAQINILRKQRIKYDDFINKNMNDVCLTDDEVKCWKKAINVKIQFLTADNVLSETDDRYDRGKKDLTLSQYVHRQDLTTLIQKIIFAIIFGYFTASAIQTNIANIIWGALQITIWLIFGLMTYIQNQNYVKNVYQQKIYRKINYLIEFNNKYKGGIKNG